MSCAISLGPGLAMLSEAINAGEIYVNEMFSSHCRKCSSSGAVSDTDRNAFLEKVDNKALCQIICCCKNTSYRQVCVQETLDAADSFLEGRSRYKAEISYNMIADPPTPFMHRDELGNSTTVRSERWQTRARNEIESYQSGKGYVRRPDVVIVKNSSVPPTQENIHRIVEMKFSGDVEGDGQYDAYREIAGARSKMTLLEEDDCNCNGDDDPVSDSIPDPIPVAIPEEQPENEPALWEIPVWGITTAVLAIATVAAFVFPFDGPVGESVAGTATAASATRLALAWSAAFATTP